MDNIPKITVLMPVYNCENYILEAVKSILQQTYTNFEFLIIDDCSTDKTVEIIKSLNDDRIQLIQKPKNTGYTNSLNFGIQIAKGEYIARMDGDDISLPMRLEKQVAFMEANVDVVVCGTLYKIINSDFVCNHPATHEEIKVKLLEGCHIAHPTVFIRNSFLKGFKLIYDLEKEPAEDYDFWSRISFLGKLANLPEVLLHYRVYENQTSVVRKNQQEKSSKEVRIKMFQYLIPNFKSELVNFNYSIQFNNKTAIFLSQRLLLLNKFLEKNKEHQIYNEKYFVKYIQIEKTKIFKYFYINKNQMTLKNAIFLFINNFEFYKSMGFKNSFKFMVKIIITK
jgi:glycosyltransferase involved in cell wall biosynthesis